MTTPTVSPEVLASSVAARLLHDVSGPLSGLVSGLELISSDSDPEMKDAGLELAAASAKALTDWLGFCRLAYGGESRTRTGTDLEALASQPLDGRRAKLIWEGGSGPFNGLVSRVILLMVQIAAAGLGSGGVATLSATRESDGHDLAVAAEGRRVAISEEAKEGLDGNAAPAGLAGRWAPSRLLRELVVGAKGQLTWSIDNERLRITVRLPGPLPPDP